MILSLLEAGTCIIHVHMHEMCFVCLKYSFNIIKYVVIINIKIQYITKNFTNHDISRRGYLTSHPISLRSILILSCYLRLALPSGLFPSSVLKILISPMCVTFGLRATVNQFMLRRSIAI
jgi:hypothetical protein